MEIFKKEQKRPYNMTDEELKEAFRLADQEAKVNILLDFQREYPLIDLEEDQTLLKAFLFLIDAGISAGIEITQNRHEIVSNYSKNNSEPSVTQYEFAVSKGVSGILTAQGKFMKCGNAEHYILTRHLSDEEEKEAMFFSSSLDGQKSGIVTLNILGKKTVSETQREWVKQNWEYMDGMQKEMYLNLINREDI